jgi:hypothetical protein
MQNCIELWYIMDMSRAEVVKKYFPKAKEVDKILYLESVGMYACVRPKGIYLQNRKLITLAELEMLSKEKLTGKLALAAIACTQTFEGSKIL